MNIGSNLPEKSLERIWKLVDWKKSAEVLRICQRDIAQAAKARNMQEVERLQGRLIGALDCRALAVRKVSNSVAQPGIDGVKWVTAAEKLAGAISLTPDNYKAKPMKLIVYTPKGDKKERKIHIPAVYDRAMHTLFAFALDPVAESWGDKASFAFRRCRSHFDAHACLMWMLMANPPPNYIVKTDVKAFYGEISHRWLMKNIPMDRHVLHQYLTCGHFFLGELFPSDPYGITLGSSLSPILGNMTLDGAQKAVYNGVHGKHHGIDYSDGHMVRFADDMVFAAHTRTSAHKILDSLRLFAGERGLRLSEEKTAIINFAAGQDFDFLARNYRLENDVVFSKPSNGAIADLEEYLRDLILPWREGQSKLIKAINHKLIGFGTYHRVTDSIAAFHYIDSLVTALTYNAVKSLYPLMRPQTIESRFFYPNRDGGATFCLADKKDVQVFRLSEVLLRVHKHLDTRKNPYIDEEYFEQATKMKEISNASGPFKDILNGQNGKCFYCGRPILADEIKTLVTIDPMCPAAHLKNKAYVHQVCCAGQVEFYKGDYPIETEYDLYSFLEKLNSDKNLIPSKDKYYRLKDYFRDCKDAVITLKMSRIEEIIGFGLSPYFRTEPSFWNRSANVMRHCWVSNGYRVRRVSLEKETVTFERYKHLGVAVYIPRAILEDRIPENAAVEFKLMMERLIRKYGIPRT